MTGSRRSGSRVTADENLRNEADRRFRVADMMVTAHSVLRDRYSRRSVALDVLILLASVALTALALADESYLNWLPWEGRPTIGVVAAGIFFLTLVAARVDWKSRSNAHDRAAQWFSRAKLELGRSAIEPDGGALARSFQTYDEASRVSIAVPDGAFLGLKSEHRFKVLVSRTLDRYPAAPVRLIRWKLRLRHGWAVVRAANPDILPEQDDSST